MAEREKNDTGVTTYDKLPRGQKEEIDFRRRAAVKAAEDKPKRRMGDVVSDVAALSPFALRDSGGAQSRYSAKRQDAIDAAKDRAEYKDLKSGPTKLFATPKGTPGMSIDEKAALRSFKVEDYAKGGKVSAASKRADGCAVKGKTKGRML
jgi:hypothetical protein